MLNISNILDFSMSFQNVNSRVKYLIKKVIDWIWRNMPVVGLLAEANLANSLYRSKTLGGHISPYAVYQL